MKPDLDKGRIVSTESAKKEEKREGPQRQANTGKTVDVRVHSYKWFMTSKILIQLWQEGQSESPEIITVRHWRAIPLCGHCVCWLPIVDTALGRSRHCLVIGLMICCSQPSSHTYLRLNSPSMDALCYKRQHLIRPDEGVKVLQTDSIVCHC